MRTQPTAEFNGVAFARRRGARVKQARMKAQLTLRVPGRSVVGSRASCSLNDKNHFRNDRCQRLPVLTIEPLATDQRVVNGYLDEPGDRQQNPGNDVSRCLE